MKQRNYDDIIPYLQAGLLLLTVAKHRFEKFNAVNGWGLYENFVPFVTEYLTACEQHPDSTVSVNR